MTTDHGSRVLVLALGRDPLPSALTEAALGWEAAGMSLSVVTLTPRGRLTATAEQLALLGRPAGAEGLDPSTTGEPRSTARKATWIRCAGPAYCWSFCHHARDGWWPTLTWCWRRTPLRSRSGGCLPTAEARASYSAQPREPAARSTPREGRSTSR